MPPKQIEMLTVQNFQSSNTTQERPQAASAPVELAPAEAAEPNDVRLARIVDLTRRAADQASQGKRSFPLL